MTKGVLFLCTGNVCRSQMVEVHPKGVDTRAVQMHELDILGHRSKALDNTSIGEFDLLITLRGDAPEHRSSLSGRKHAHWPIPDLARAAESVEQELAEFRSARNELAKRISTLASRLASEPAHAVLARCLCGDVKVIAEAA